MREDASIQRCLGFAKSLNRDLGWHVPESVLLEYAQAITQSDQMSDVQCCYALRYYHADHRRVQALCDKNDPTHHSAWLDLNQEVSKIVLAKLGRTHQLAQNPEVLHDLTQEALQQIAAGLSGFGYHSSFKTWFYTVSVNCIAQHFRRQSTDKRRADAEGQSLEKLVGQGERFYDPVPTPEDLVLDRTLVALIGQVLNEQPDERVGLVFRLWVFDEQPLRAIGEKLSLSPARVHGLCKQASTLLRQHPAVLEWLRSIELDSRIDA